MDGKISAEVQKYNYLLREKLIGLIDGNHYPFELFHLTLAFAKYLELQVHNTIQNDAAAAASQNPSKR